MSAFFICAGMILGSSQSGKLTRMGVAAASAYGEWVNGKLARSVGY